MLRLEMLRQSLASWLTRPSSRFQRDPFADFAALSQTLKPGDVLLVEGETKVARIIQVLTRSVWSHAALYVGDAALHHRDKQVRAHARRHGRHAQALLLEADINSGVALVPLAKYAQHPVRICRPEGMKAADRRRLLDFGLQRLCEPYDTGQLLDLIRYLLPLAQLPAQLAQRLWLMGSGEGNRTICSTMLVEAFQAVGYPVLPEIAGDCKDALLCYRVRNARLFVPADFDRSPFFRIIKHQGLDHPRFRRSKFQPNLINWQ